MDKNPQKRTLCFVVFFFFLVFFNVWCTLVLSRLLGYHFSSPLETTSFMNGPLSKPLSRKDRLDLALFVSFTFSFRFCLRPVFEWFLSHFIDRFRQSSVESLPVPVRLERVKGVTKTLIFSLWLAHSSHSSLWYLCILPRDWYYIQKGSKLLMCSIESVEQYFLLPNHFWHLLYFLI